MRIIYFALVLALTCPLAVDFFKLFRTVPAMAEASQRADFILVEKFQRKLTLYKNQIAIQSYQVALGSQPVGSKQKEGDGRTPEGDYTIDFKHPKSRFHFALRLSYPSKAEQGLAASNGYSAGSDIMIHGIRNGFGFIGSQHRRFDWTDGCIAVTNEEIEDIWHYVDLGTTIRIVP
jgi:murein L,D-transpeptidase YafK